MRSGWLFAEGLVLKSDEEFVEKPDMTGFHRWLGCRNGQVPCCVKSIEVVG